MIDLLILTFFWLAEYEKSGAKVEEKAGEDSRYRRSVGGGCSRRGHQLKGGCVVRGHGWRLIFDKTVSMASATSVCV